MHEDAVTFCADSFWDLNITWYTATPDFTDCFQHLILVLVPCVVLCVIALPYLFLLPRFHQKHCLPWTALNVSKLMLCICLLILSFTELCITVYRRVTGQVTHDIGLFSSVAKVLTFVIIAIMINQHRRYGVKASTLLFIFWLTMSICGTVIIRSEFLKIIHQEFPSLLHDKFSIDMISNPLIYCQLFLSIFIDAKWYSEKDEKESPLEEIPSFLFWTFDWLNMLIWRSQKKFLAVKDFLPLSVKLQSGKQWEKFQTKWVDYSFKKIEENFDKGEKKSSVSMICVVVKAFWPWILWSCFCELGYDILRFIPPLLLNLIIDFIGTNQYAWRGYLYCVLLFAVMVSSKWAFNASMFYPTVLGLQIKAAFTSAIYRKSLQMSNSARRNYTSGEMINLMAVDLDRIFEFVIYSPLTFGIPIRIIVGVLMLWKFLGVSCLAGVATVVLIIPVILIVAKVNHYVQVRQMKMKDLRLKHMSEILNSMKVLKLWAWEEPFMNKVSNIRKKEVKLIREFYLCYASASFVWGCAPFLIAVASFATFVMVDDKNILYPSTAFVSLNLINMMKFSLFAIPDLISKIVQAKVSLKRLKEFLLCENCSSDSVGSNPDEGDSITIRSATLSWDVSEEPLFKNLNFHVQQGMFVAVIGLVGSAKSSLLSALLGIMYKLSGTVDIKGKLAYVPQQAWIQNRTVRENILFLKPMDKEFYGKVVDKCCLKPDLKLLRGGDDTEIGEKGVNLSGGQKQRISLARAVYQDADIYLLDDPLGAVDSHVGKDIFDSVVGNTGMLKDKTRVLVTHNLSFLPDVDIIVSMKDGMIEEVGTYHELMEHSASFSEFVQKHMGFTEPSPDEAKTTKSAIIEAKEPKLLSSPILVMSSSHLSLSDASFKDREPDAGRLVDEEHMEIGGVKRRVHVSYFKHAGPVILSISFFGYVSYQAFELGANFWLMEWSKDPVFTDGHQSTSQRNNRIIVYSLLGLTQGVFNVLGNVLLAIGVARASRLYHVHMLDSVMKSPMSFFDTTPVGRIINRFAKDMDVIDTQIPIELDGWIASFLFVLGTFIVISVATPAFLVAAVPVCILYLYLQKLYLNTSRQIKRLEATTRSPVFSHFAETLQGVSCIKAFKAERQFTRMLEMRTDDNTACLFGGACCSRWLAFRLDMLGCTIAFISSLLAVAQDNSLSAAIVGLSLSYALSVTDTMYWLVKTGTELENKSVSIERVDEYSHLPSEAPWHVYSKCMANTWPENATIQFDNYSTRYREGLSLVLRGINLNVQSGEKLGIIGRTGAGKSSITLALFRIIEPAEGRILIDGIDVSQIGVHDLRSKLTIIPQDPVLFTGSLRMNLDPNEEYTDEEIWTSLEHAHLKKFVSSLSDGLGYEIAENGDNLSLGQRQLLCLARALLKKTKILVLDEATASVDFETDDFIQETIRSDFPDCTVITIAHRLNTILDYNRVVVMDKGRIVEVGNPSELLTQTKSLFYKMAETAGIV